MWHCSRDVSIPSSKRIGTAPPNKYNHPNKSSCEGTRHTTLQKNTCKKDQEDISFHKFDLSLWADHTLSALLPLKHLIWGRPWVLCMGIHRKGFFSPLNFNETYDDTITGPCELCEQVLQVGFYTKKKNGSHQIIHLFTLLLLTPRGYHSSLLLEVVISWALVMPSK